MRIRDSDRGSVFGSKKAKMICKKLIHFMLEESGCTLSVGLGASYGDRKFFSWRSKKKYGTLHFFNEKILFQRFFLYLLFSRFKNMCLVWTHQKAFYPESACCITRTLHGLMEPVFCILLKIQEDSTDIFLSLSVTV